MNNTTATSDRPYPRKCFACRQRAVDRVYEPRTVTAKYDGRSYTLEIARFPIDRCRHCGEEALTNAADDAINRALRETLHLLEPDQLVANCQAIGLSRRELARDIGFAEESVSRWVNGAVLQSRPYDRILRAYFALPELRNFLRALNDNPALGTVAVADQEDSTIVSHYAKSKGVAPAPPVIEIASADDPNKQPYALAA
ncbi:MAG: hypothetical protein KJZ69_09545 [Phycisphaerales bacterium]|nr:hypothetical protein [Phycisphaerales bacterium]